MTVRVAFLGNDAWSVPSLEALAGEPETAVVLVLTNPPRPAGRGGRPRATAVADAAGALGLPLVEAGTTRRGRGLEALAASRADVVAVVAYGELLGPDVLDLAPLGAVNLHFSLLPRWRGASPVQHAILAGDERSGVTVMRIDRGLDTGPILGSLEEPIRPDDDAGTLGARLASLGAVLLVGVIRQLPTAGLPARAQDAAGATHAPRLTAADRVLDWAAPAEAVVRRVRALAPDPGATTTFRGEPLKVLAAGVGHDEPDGAAPGTVVAWDDRGVAVAAGEGVVRLTEVAPAGRKRMPAAGWARGARFAAEERLG